MLIDQSVAQFVELWGDVNFGASGWSDSGNRVVLDGDLEACKVAPVFGYDDGDAFRGCELEVGF